MWEYIIKPILKKNQPRSYVIPDTNPVSPAYKVENNKKENKIESSNLNSSRILKCPVCKVDMERKLLKFSQVEIDMCPNCNGIFLDKGELEEITGFDVFSFPSNEKPLIIYKPKSNKNL